MKYTWMSLGAQGTSCDLSISKNVKDVSIIKLISKEKGAKNWDAIKHLNQNEFPHIN